MTMVRVPWMSTKARFDQLTEQYAEVTRELGLARAAHRDMVKDYNRVLNDRNRLAGEMAQVRAALSEVAVYEGLVDVSPVAMMVSELVRDHEELEARIDAVMSLLRPKIEGGSEWVVHSLEDFREIARLLQGGKRVPDTPEGLSG